MDTLGILAMGIGAFMMFEAVKNHSPQPITKARSILADFSKPAGIPAAQQSAANTLDQPPKTQAA